MIDPGVWNTLVLTELNLGLRACANSFNPHGALGHSFDFYSFLKLQIEYKICFDASWLTCKGTG